MLSGFAGLGHMVLAGSLVHLFLILRTALRTPDAPAPGSDRADDARATGSV